MARELNYSGLDRLLHRVAFAGPFVQLTAADIEHALWGSTYSRVHAGRPIFITSLPRAGTTLMLEALNRLPSLATHVYRDMPFVMAPVLWSRLSGPFRQPSQLSERAHGDGMEIGFDSPEAFEEILWRTFWPAKYTPTGITLWSAADANEDARRFFVDHMKKIVALRRPGRPADGRYVSKNNGNIARLEALRALFPDAAILLVLRHPLDHARSLLRQHRNFLTMHQETPFVRRYMDDIGHYEFGELHRPIGFPGLREHLQGQDPLTLGYWLGYWIAAFDYVTTHIANVTVISYEDACADPHRALQAICEALDIDPDGALPEAAALFNDRPASRVESPDIEASQRDRAEQIYAGLRSHSLI